MRLAFVYLNDNCYVSQGAGSVASAVLDAGYTLDFFDTAYLSLEDVVARVLGDSYDLLLISASTLFYGQACTLARRVKQSRAIPILLGGIHATIIKGKILEECPEIDYTCIGEGEDFILDFLDALKKGDVSKVLNLGYRNPEGEVVLNPIRPCTDLDGLPCFHYGLFDPASVVQPFPLPGFCYVYATRGCPFRCSYCCNPCYFDLYGRSYLRKRKVDSVIAELLWLKECYPVKLFYFGDEMILFDEAYVTKLFTRVKEEVQLAYGCMARVEKITPYIVELFRVTGCRYVGMGIECGDEEFRKKWLNRHMTNAQIVEAFQSLRRGVPGVTLTSYNMTGYPVSYDARLTAATEALNRLVKPDIVQRSIFFPFPGTKLHDYCTEHDLIDPRKLREIRDYFSQSVLRDATP